MIVHGGFVKNLTATDDTWALDLASGKWRQLALTSEPRAGFGYSFVPEPVPRMVLSWGLKSAQSGPGALLIGGGVVALACADLENRLHKPWNCSC